MVSASVQATACAAAQAMMSAAAQAMMSAAAREAVRAAAQATALGRRARSATAACGWLRTTACAMRLRRGSDRPPWEVWINCFREPTANPPSGPWQAAGGGAILRAGLSAGAARRERELDDHREVGVEVLGIEQPVLSPRRARGPRRFPRGTATPLAARRPPVRSASRPANRPPPRARGPGAARRTGS